MYFIKRALKYLRNKKGKTLLLGIIFLVIANFVLAGLLVQNASKKAQDQTRISIGADINYIMNYDGLMNDVERGVLDYEELVDMKTAMGQGVVHSTKFTEGGAPTYSNFIKVVDSEYVENYDMGISYEVSTEDLRQYTLDTSAQNSGSGTTAFDVKLFVASEPKVFTDENAELVSGRYASTEEINSGSNVILIEENIAQLNSLRLGDTLTLSTSILEYQDVDIDYEIIGIYRSLEEINTRIAAKGGNSLLPQNRFYIPFNALQSIGMEKSEIDNILITSNVISLKDPLYIDAFKQEARGKIELKYGRLDANDALYSRLMGPIESLGYISKILVVIIAVAGALIIGLITALTVNERQEEIGILLAVGESKLKIVSQFVLEVTLMALIAFTLSSFTGSYLGENISDAVLGSELLQKQDSANTGKVYKGKAYNAKGYSDKQKNVQDIIKNEATVDISLNVTVLFQLLSLGLLLSVLSTVIPSLYVMRFNPKQILSNRSS